VYCPPDTGRSDSKIVWILLSVAVLLAASGITAAWVVFRKKS
jgi:flagellar basal body-associated protein FliL